MSAGGRAAAVVAVVVDWRRRAMCIVKTRPSGRLGGRVATERPTDRLDDILTQSVS